jgi:hypothetical protein
MIDFAKLPLSERLPYFDEVANRRGLTRLVVEKDFWVCFTLRILFSQCNLANRLVFKGGTSLSKVFGIIKRFSEDIDLSIDPDWLGFGGDDAPEAARSRSEFKKCCRRLEQACISRVEGEIQRTLEQAITDVLGPPSTSDSHLLFRVDTQTHSPVLIFGYPTEERKATEYIPAQVKLELGSLTDQRPHGNHSMIPWVAEEFPDVFKEVNCQVVALEAERSFWEKATILHAEYHRPADSAMRYRLSRDCYDLCCMAAHETGKRALKDLCLLARVVRHKQTFFRSSWTNYKTAKPGTLRLIPKESRLPELKSDYERMQEMFLETPPHFDTLLEQLAELEQRINGPIA